MRNAVPRENAERAEQAVWEFLKMDPVNPDTWYPDPPRRGIMVEIYQHQALWNNRQTQKSIKLSVKSGKQKNYGLVLTEPV